MRTNVYLSLGTNQGDRRANIEAALCRLDELLGCHYAALSDLVETPAWGFEGPDFLNCVVLYTLDRDCRRLAVEQALELLDICKRIESGMGRVQNVAYAADGSRIYHSRPIDIDILFYGRERISHPRLTIPHPLISQRDFVKIPLRQVARRSLRDAFPDKSLYY